MNFDPSAHRPRRHAPGAVEIRYNCPRIGGHDGKIDRDGCLTFNRISGLYFCHNDACRWAGRAEGYDAATFAPNVKDPPRPGEVSAVPEHAHALFHARGLDAVLTIRRYRVRWRDQRLLWPGDPGYAGRATVPGQEPKQLSMDGFSQKGGSLIGAHLLTPGAHVVVVQGDYGAASVPDPWIGVGAEGVVLHEAQASRIILSRPASVTLCGDGGEPMEAPPVLALSGIPVRNILDLPPKFGLDDLPMKERVARLLAAGEAR